MDTNILHHVSWILILCSVNYCAVIPNGGPFDAQHNQNEIETVELMSTLEPIVISQFERSSNNGITNRHQLVRRNPRSIKQMPVIHSPKQPVPSRNTDSQIFTGPVQSSPVVNTEPHINPPLIQDPISTDPAVNQQQSVDQQPELTDRGAWLRRFQKLQEIRQELTNQNPQPTPDNPPVSQEHKINSYLSNVYDSLMVGDMPRQSQNPALQSNLNQNGFATKRSVEGDSAINSGPTNPEPSQGLPFQAQTVQDPLQNNPFSVPDQIAAKPENVLTSLGQAINQALPSAPTDRVSDDNPYQKSETTGLKQPYIPEATHTRFQQHGRQLLQTIPENQNPQEQGQGRTPDPPPNPNPNLADPNSAVGQNAPDPFSITGQKLASTDPNESPQNLAPNQNQQMPPGSQSPFMPQPTQNAPPQNIPMPTPNQNQPESLPKNPFSSQNAPSDDNPLPSQPPSQQPPPNNQPPNRYPQNQYPQQGPMPSQQPQFPSNQQQYQPPNQPQYQPPNQQARPGPYNGAPRPAPTGDDNTKPQFPPNQQQFPPNRQQLPQSNQPPNQYPPNQPQYQPPNQQARPGPYNGAPAMSRPAPTGDDNKQYPNQKPTAPYPNQNQAGPYPNQNQAGPYPNQKPAGQNPQGGDDNKGRPGPYQPPNQAGPYQKPNQGGQYPQPIPYPYQNPQARYPPQQPKQQPPQYANKPDDGLPPNTNRTAWLHAFWLAHRNKMNPTPLSPQPTPYIPPPTHPYTGFHPGYHQPLYTDKLPDASPTGTYPSNYHPGSPDPHGRLNPGIPPHNLIPKTTPIPTAPTPAPGPKRPMSESELEEIQEAEEDKREMLAILNAAGHNYQTLPPGFTMPVEIEYEDGLTPPPPKAIPPKVNKTETPPPYWFEGPPYNGMNYFTDGKPGIYPGKPFHKDGVGIYPLTTPSPLMPGYKYPGHIQQPTNHQQAYPQHHNQPTNQHQFYNQQMPNQNQQYKQPLGSLQARYNQTQNKQPIPPPIYRHPSHNQQQPQYKQPIRNQPPQYPNRQPNQNPRQPLKRPVVNSQPPQTNQQNPYKPPQTNQQTPYRRPQVQQPNQNKPYRPPTNQNMQRQPPPVGRPNPLNPQKDQTAPNSARPQQTLIPQRNRVNLSAANRGQAAFLNQGETTTVKSAVTNSPEVVIVAQAGFTANEKAGIIVGSLLGILIILGPLLCLAFKYRKHLKMKRKRLFPRPYSSRNQHRRSQDAMETMVFSELGQERLAFDSDGNGNGVANSPKETDRLMNQKPVQNQNPRKNSTISTISEDLNVYNNNTDNTKSQSDAPNTVMSLTSSKRADSVELSRLMTLKERSEEEIYSEAPERPARPPPPLRSNKTRLNFPKHYQGSVQMLHK